MIAAGRVAIVTGGGRGIGLSLVELLAEQGVRLVVNDLDPEPANAAAAAARARGAEAIACVGSVTAPDFPDKIVAIAKETFGDAHIVVNNAGYVWNGLIHKQTDAQWDAMQDVHLKAPFRLARALHPLIVERVADERAGGRPLMRKIVNVMSTAATGGAVGHASYAAAKAGLYGLTRTLAKEWGPLDVNVNAVALGLIETRLTAVSTERQSITIEGRSMPVGFRPENRDVHLTQIALQRPGTPREAAGAIALLCSNHADYVTGQILNVDGGLSN